MPYFVYIISNFKNTPLYTGVTNNLERRTYEHKNKLHTNSFSTKYNLNQLLYWKISNNIDSAIAREKQIKNWKKEWKINLIKTNNPNFKDLSLLDNWVNSDSETSSE
jgi:putative endonuclease